jgi:hypothetical protein
MRGAMPLLTQYIFMAWCLVKHREKFTFTFYILHFGYVAGRARSRSGRCDEGEKSLPLSKSNPGSPACSLVTILTELLFAENS